MCYDDQALPPDPPGGGGAAQGQELVLTAQDGTRFAAYQATPDRPAPAQVLIYPDVRGLHNFYKALALRFAEVGYAALAIDYFGRTAGLSSRDEGFEFMPHVQQMTLESFEQDVSAALAHLRVPGQPAAVFVVGFCMGGTLTLMTGTNPEHSFAGLIPFYSGLTRSYGERGTPLENARLIRYPVLGHFGGDDPGIPPESVAALDQQLDAAGVEHQLMVYPGAPHSFFDRRASDFAEDSAQAWQSTLGFMRRHSER